NNEPLVMEFTIPAGEKVDMDLVESSFDLMSNPMFKMTKRKNWMMPTPFVLNDAVVITQKIKPTPVAAIEQPQRPFYRRNAVAQDSIPLQNDTIR
ncbi:MAG: peptidase M28, partial [Flavobacteriaceae bacterium]